MNRKDMIKKHYLIILIISCHLNNDLSQKKDISKCEIPQTKPETLESEQQKIFNFTCKGDFGDNYTQWKNYYKKLGFDVSSCDSGIQVDCTGNTFSLYFADTNNGVFGEIYVSPAPEYKCDFSNVKHTIRIQKSKSIRYPNKWTVGLDLNKKQNSLNFIPINTDLYCILTGYYSPDLSFLEEKPQPSSLPLKFEIK